MTTLFRFSEVRNELASIVESGESALMIGAGASVASGAPITRDLVERIRARFPLADVAASSGLFEAGSIVCDTPPYDRQELVRFISSVLAPLQPSEGYKQIPRIRWSSLFTTNYDDLLEKAYEAPGRAQTIQPVDLSFGKTTVPRDQRVQLYYLMGSIRATPTSDSSPVLTWADYHRTVQEREPILRLISNVLAAGGKVIYLGYSFNDFLLDSVLDEAVRRVGNLNMPYGYAILNAWPGDRRQPVHKMLMRKVVPVDGAFEDFADLVKEIADGGPITITTGSPSVGPAAGKSLSIAGTTIAITETQAGVYSEAFELVDDSILKLTDIGVDSEAAAAASFLKGESMGWLPFLKGWAFQRPAYARVLSDVVEVCKQTSRAQTVILIHGAAGLGKSVMARQLAIDVYRRAKVPVLLAKAGWRARPDLKLLGRVSEDLEAVLPPDSASPPLVLIIDEAELLDRTVPSRIASFMKGRGRSVVVVLFARTNEYFRSITVPTSAGRPFGYPDIEKRIDERISPAETEEVIKHLIAIGLWPRNKITDKDFWIRYIDGELNGSFFDAIYSLVDQSKVPLADRVWSEYENLSYLARQAYLLIAGVHQFGIPLKMEILMRALKLEFARFESEIIKSDAREVLFSEHETSELNVFFRGRTRIISQLVFERALPERKDQLEVFKRTIEATNPNEMFGMDELDMLRTLLVQVFGPGGHDRRFAPEDLAELFRIATEVIEDDVLEHHYGLVEKERGRLMSARSHLDRALELSAVLPYDLATLRESPQNIENSLAMVIGALADDALKRGAPAQASELFEEARNHFVNARTGTFPNAAAYDAHARMLRTRAMRLFKSGTTDRAIALGEVLDVIADGIDNVNEEFRQSLMDLKVEVMEELGLDDDLVSDLEKRASHGSAKERARCETVLARVFLGKALKPKNLKRALLHASKACEVDPEYCAAWKIRAEVHAQLHPTEYGERISYLAAAKECADTSGNLWVLYELGLSLFMLERYGESAKAFVSLRKASRGHSKSSVVQELAGERAGGEPFEFSGRVVRRDSRNDLAIECAPLADFGSIWFNPRTQKLYTARIGDQVAFLVGFNYRGVEGVEVERI